MTDLSASYADFILATSFDRLPVAVVERAKLLVLDVLGVALAGYRLSELSRLVIDEAVATGGAGQATFFQTPGSYPACAAAFVNAALCHALDMDDGHRYAALHPGTVVIPAALAAAQERGATSREFIEGVVCGYEVMIRLGMAINPSSLRRGFHSTGTVGPFGAAAAAAKIMKLDRDAIADAFGIAGLQGSGLLQVNHDEGAGGQAKLINSARASMSGLYSARLAGRGGRGPARILEGKDGFLGAFADDVRPELATRGLGQAYEILQTYLKFYASGRHSHACLDAALAAFHDSGLAIGDIDRIEVATYATAIRFTGITEVNSPTAARFSIGFAIALALRHGDAAADKFTDRNIADAATRALAARVSVAQGETWEARYPEQRGATVRIVGRNGSESTAEVALARGEPENPASLDDVMAKFHVNAGVQLPRAKADRLAGIVLDLDRQPLSCLTEALA